jgi:hypothetical protein
MTRLLRIEYLGTWYHITFRGNGRADIFVDDKDRGKFREILHESREQYKKELRGCEMRMTHIPSPGDEAGLRRLGINLTSDPNFPSRDLLMY